MRSTVEEGPEKSCKGHDVHMSGVGRGVGGGGGGRGEPSEISHNAHRSTNVTCAGFEEIKREYKDILLMICSFLVSKEAFKFYSIKW